MFGGVVPPPTPSKSGSDDNLFNEMYSRGGGLFLNSEQQKEKDRKGRKELLENEDEVIIYQVISFVICHE